MHFMQLLRMALSDEGAYNLEAGKTHYNTKWCSSKCPLKQLHNPLEVWENGTGGNRGGGAATVQ